MKTFSDEGRVLRIGAEPVVAWTWTEDGSPRWSIASPGWNFMLNDGILLRLGAGSLISGTPLDEAGMSLVPSDELPDLEHGRIRIAGFSLADMRDIRLQHGREGWLSVWTRITWTWWANKWRLRGRPLRRYRGDEQSADEV